MISRGATTDGCFVELTARPGDVQPQAAYPRTKPPDDETRRDSAVAFSSAVATATIDFAEAHSAVADNVVGKAVLLPAALVVLAAGPWACRQDGPGDCFPVVDFPGVTPEGQQYVASSGERALMSFQPPTGAWDWDISIACDSTSTCDPARLDRRFAWSIGNGDHASIHSLERGERSVRFEPPVSVWSECPNKRTLRTTQVGSGDVWTSDVEYLGLEGVVVDLHSTVVGESLAEVQLAADWSAWLWFEFADYPVRFELE